MSKEVKDAMEVKEVKERNVRIIRAQMVRRGFILHFLNFLYLLNLLLYFGAVEIPPAGFRTTSS